MSNDKYMYLSKFCLKGQSTSKAINNLTRDLDLLGYNLVSHSIVYPPSVALDGRVVTVIGKRKFLGIF